jgi:hypothetical protein
MNLTPEHYQMLHEGSGIADEVIVERGYRSLGGAEGYADLIRLGFSKTQARNTLGLFLPLHSTDGRQTGGQYRPDTPRLNRQGVPISAKYEWPADAGVRLDCPPRCQPQLGDPAIRLWLTEGSKKADSLASRGACAVALAGVNAFKGKNGLGGVAWLADWDYIALNGRDVCTCYDSDVMQKLDVRKALERLIEHLHRKGAAVRTVYLPSVHGHKLGVDDFFVAGHTLADLEALIEAPRPQPQPAPEQIELLDAAPLILRKPLQLIDETAYAASWLHVRVRTTEMRDKHGEIIRLATPREEIQRHLFVIRQDGAIFGPGGTHTLTDLALDVALSSPPREEKLWRAPAIKGYHQGARPDPADVFCRVAAVYNTFIDFAQSLGNQQVMCELSACLSFTTWLHDAFSVLPYPWPNGERGSGKTHWGTCWARTSYLGEVVLSSGSFAALRDLAEHGAALLFDDAESLTDVKRCEPNKLELLLAGNRRGAVVPLKDPAPQGKGWITRWVDAYSPRGFTAIRLPHNALERRVIVLPLVRTADARRGNADPADDAKWPEPPRLLQDALWETALMLLSEAAAVWRELSNEPEAWGAEFEPWRAVLGVAQLLTRHGVTDLETRMRTVMDAQGKRI